MLDTEGTDVIAVAAISCAVMAEWQKFNEEYKQKHGISTDHCRMCWLTKGAQYSEDLKLIIQYSQVFRIIRPPRFTYADFCSFLDKLDNKAEVLTTSSACHNRVPLPIWKTLRQNFANNRQSIMETVNKYKMSKEGMYVQTGVSRF